MSALVALVLVAGVACSPPAATPVPSTGVAGFALAGPTCPVERPGQSACVRAVAGAEVVARDPSGAVVARTVTDARGAYFLPLAPGTYVIEPQPVQGLMGTARPATVTVTAGTPSALDLEYDTGIR